MNTGAIKREDFQRFIDFARPHINRCAGEYKFDCDGDSCVGVALDPNKAYAKSEPDQLLESLGLVPEFLAHYRPGEDVRDTIDREYAHGGGVFALKGFKVHSDDLKLGYGDDLDDPIAILFTELNPLQLVIAYPNAYFAIQSTDNPESFTITRLD